MKPSTKDELEGKFHEVKGKVKEKAGNSRTILAWKLKAEMKREAAKFRKRSVRSRRFWGSSESRRRGEGCEARGRH